jgi:hypothetical protein
MYAEIIEFQDNYIRVLIAMISKNSNFSICQTVLKNVKNIALCTHMFLYKLRFIVVQKKKIVVILCYDCVEDCRVLCLKNCYMIFSLSTATCLFAVVSKINQHVTFCFRKEQILQD